MKSLNSAGGANYSPPPARPLPQNEAALRELLRKAEEFTVWLVEFENEVALHYDPAMKDPSFPTKYGLVTLLMNLTDSHVADLEPFFGRPPGVFAAILHHYIPSSPISGDNPIRIESDCDLLELVGVALAESHAFCAECRNAILRLRRGHLVTLTQRHPTAKDQRPAVVQIVGGATAQSSEALPWNRLRVDLPARTVWVDGVAYPDQERLPLLYLQILIQQEGRPITEKQIGEKQPDLQPYVGKLGPRVRDLLPSEVSRFIGAQAGLGHVLITPVRVGS